jgi:hypothetical protein
LVFYDFGFWKTVTETFCGKSKTESSVNRIFRFGFRFNRKNRIQKLASGEPCRLLGWPLASGDGRLAMADCPAWRVASRAGCRLLGWPLVATGKRCRRAAVPAGRLVDVDGGPVLTSCGW